MPGVLEGIRVLDFGRYIAGPYCAALLAEQGAEVIRIEKREGSEDRFQAPVSETGDGALFLQMNRNKLGMTLDPMSAEGQQVVRKLVATADVVVANLPPQTLVDMQQGTGRYDIFPVDVMWLAEYAAAGFLEPQMKYVKNPDLTDADYEFDDFLPRVLSGACVYNDTLFCVPIGAGAVGTTWRKDLADAAGIALPPKFDPKFNTAYMRDISVKMNKPLCAAAACN